MDFNNEIRLEYNPQEFCESHNCHVRETMSESATTARMRARCCTGESSMHPDYALSYVSLVRIIHVNFSLDRKIWGGGGAGSRRKRNIDSRSEARPDRENLYNKIYI